MAAHFLHLIWVQRMGSHCYYLVTVLVLAIRSVCFVSSGRCMRALRNFNGQVAIFELASRVKILRDCL